MATTCTFKCQRGAGGYGYEVSGTLSLNDVVINSVPNATGSWSTASVTADLQQRIYVSAANAATAGVDEGWYQKVGDATFRKM